VPSFVIESCTVSFSRVFFHFEIRSASNLPFFFLALKIGSPEAVSLWTQDWSGPESCEVADSTVIRLGAYRSLGLPFRQYLSLSEFGALPNDV
jgi:hypothetical protein